MFNVRPLIYDLDTLVAYEQAQDPDHKRILCLDFDGVLHAYQQGWQGATVIPGDHIAGSIEFLLGAMKDFSVHIYSNRCNLPGGIEAMCQWLVYHIAICYPEYDMPRVIRTVEHIWFDKLKPPAWLTIDDRAFQFRGSFPDLAYIDKFRPWYQPQVWTDQALARLWQTFCNVRDLSQKTNAQLADLLVKLWADYAIDTKESALLSEIIGRLQGDDHATT